MVPLRGFPISGWPYWVRTALTPKTSQVNEGLVLQSVGGRGEGALQPSDFFRKVRVFHSHGDLALDPTNGFKHEDLAF